MTNQALKTTIDRDEVARLSVAVIVVSAIGALGCLAPSWYSSGPDAVGANVGWPERPLILMSLLMMMFGAIGAATRNPIASNLLINTALIFLASNVVAAFSSGMSAASRFSSSGFGSSVTPSFGLFLSLMTSVVLLVLSVASSRMFFVKLP